MATTTVPLVPASALVPGGVATIRRELDAISEATTRVAQTQDTLIRIQDALSRTLRDMRMASRRFVGTIRDYRYTAGRAGEMPSHRFYVESEGGLWLYAKVPSDRFEPMMVDMSIELTPDAVNGTTILCEPDPEINAMVPLQVIEIIKLRDRFGGLLYKGAPVLCSNGTGLRVGVVTDGDGTTVEVALDERELADDRIQYNQSEIARLF